MVTSRTGTMLGVGLLAYFLIPKPSRQQRRRARRDATYAAHDRAGADPEFMAEMRGIMAEFDGTSAGGRREDEDNR